MLEARAAQAPTVSNMSISASEDGISAGCGFSGYDNKNEYVIQLFLNRVKDDGSIQKVVSAELDVSADGRGSGSTAWEHVENGVYKATAAVKRYEGGNLAETVFADSVLYRVEKEGDSYIITPYEKEPESGGGPDGRPGSGEDAENNISWKSGREDKKEYPVCSHDRIFDVVQEADPGRDALLEESCSRCGEIFSYSYVPNSAYAAFLKEAARAVLSAEGEEVLIATDRWMSFNQEVLEAIAARPAVAVTIHYRDCGKLYAVTIPAGTDAAGLADENGYCGFRYLQQLYSGEERFSQEK